MNAKRGGEPAGRYRAAAIVAIGAEIVMAATIGLSGVIGLHGHASAAVSRTAEIAVDYRAEVAMGY